MNTQRTKRLIIFSGVLIVESSEVSSSTKHISMLIVDIIISSNFCIEAFKQRNKLRCNALRQKLGFVICPYYVTCRCNETRDAQ